VKPKLMVSPLSQPWGGMKTALPGLQRTPLCTFYHDPVKMVSTVLAVSQLLHLNSVELDMVSSLGKIVTQKPTSGKYW
jgi:hypothetical protein